MELLVLFELGGEDEEDDEDEEGVREFEGEGKLGREGG